MQLKTLTVVAASLALAHARVNGTWGDETKAPVLDTTTTTPVTLPTKPVDKPEVPVDGGKTDVADEVVSSTTTWAETDFPTETPVDGGKTDVADSTTSSTTSSTTYYWGDESMPVDGGKTDVADETTSSTTASWSDYTKVPELTTTEETTVEEVTKTITKGDGSQITTTEHNTHTITKTVYVTPTPVSGGQGQPPAGGPPKETPVLGGEATPPVGGGCGVVTTTVTTVKTITVPAGAPVAPTGGQFFPKPPPAATTTTPVVEASTFSRTWQDQTTGFATSAAPAAPSSGGYMGVVEQWRAAMGLAALDKDDKLQSNAQDASNSSGGALKHKLNPGSMAQVMAPGDADNFESVFVGGWLCELPNTPGLGSSVCKEMSKGWNYAGQTGHAEILTSGKYSKIGCGLGDGIWTCDLA